MDRGGSPFDSCPSEGDGSSSSRTGNSSSSVTVGGKGSSSSGNGGNSSSSSVGGGGADLTWTIVPNITFYAEGLTFVGDKFFAFGDGGELAYSTDGMNWTTVSNTTFGNMPIKGIAWNGIRYVMVGRDDNVSKMAYSDDGISWMAVSNTTFGTAKILGIGSGEGKFIAFDGAVRAQSMAESTDGINWTKITPSFPFTNQTDYRIEAITYGGGKFVARAGYNYDIVYSTDGINWQMVPKIHNGEYDGTFDGIIIAITWSGSRFVAVGRNSEIAYSTNGTNWTYIPYETSGNTTFGKYGDINDIAWGGGRFIAVGSANLGNSKWAQSTDGTNWTEINRGTVIGTPMNNGGSWVFHIAYGAGRFVVSGYHTSETIGYPTYYIAYSNQ
jgi:hypothetical protein